MLWKLGGGSLVCSTMDVAMLALPPEEPQQLSLQPVRGFAELLAEKQGLDPAAVPAHLPAMQHW